MNSQITCFLILLSGAALFFCQGCFELEGSDQPYVPSPRAIVHTPAGTSGGDVTITFQLIDRECDTGDVALAYSTDGGQSFNAATLVNPGDATGLETDIYPGKLHVVAWNSAGDGVGVSGSINVCVRVTPSDAGNPSGSLGISGLFLVDNTAYNQPPAVTAATPAGVQSGNVQISYFLSDVESDTCSIQVHFSADNGATWDGATMGPAGEGVTGLASSPSGSAHVYRWNSGADGVAPSGQIDIVRIRITPTDFHEGSAGQTASFSVDNTISNVPPTVSIASGPADGSTVGTQQVTFTWSGSDTDGTVIGYYYSFDHDPPDTWTTNTSVTSGVFSEGTHTFRLVAVDDNYDVSAVASRAFTVSIAGTIEADFTATPLSGNAPLTVYFTDQSTSTSGITSWSWTFGDGGTSTERDPVYTYNAMGTYDVALTVSGPDGSDILNRTAYIAVNSGGTTPNASELECFDIVNQERATAGREALCWSDGLYNCAKAHSCDMCDRGFFSHVNLESEDPTERGRLGHAGSYTFPSIVPTPYVGIAENIAQNYTSAQQVMDAWMNSSGHRANILNEAYTDIGVGLCTGCARHWTQCFAVYSGGGKG